MPAGRPRKVVNEEIYGISDEDLMKEVPQDELSINDYRDMWESALLHSKQLQETVDGYIVREKELLRQIQNDRETSQRFINKLVAHFDNRIALIFSTIDNVKALMADPDLSTEKE